MCHSEGIFDAQLNSVKAQLLLIKQDFLHFVDVIIS